MIAMARGKKFTEYKTERGENGSPVLQSLLPEKKEHSGMEGKNINESYCAGYIDLESSINLTVP